MGGLSLKQKSGVPRSVNLALSRSLICPATQRTRVSGLFGLSLAMARSLLVALGVDLVSDPRTDLPKRFIEGVLLALAEQVHRHPPVRMTFGIEIGPIDRAVSDSSCREIARNVQQIFQRGLILDLINKLGRQWCTWCTWCTCVRRFRRFL